MDLRVTSYDAFVFNLVVKNMSSRLRPSVFDGPEIKVVMA